MPPLQAIRAFVAAVRLRSFAGAAEALGLTHGAISHHAAAIEQHVGQKLFERHRRGVTPTEVAEALAERLGHPLRDLAQAFAEARRDSRASVTITTTPAFAARWLIPRLSRFQERHSDIDLRLQPTAALLDLGLHGIDLAIRYGTGGWPGTDSRLLMREYVFPVAGRDFNGGDLPRDRAAILKGPLIRNPRQSWRPWLRAAGARTPREPASGPLIDDPGLALDLAARGQGIALARASLAEDDIAAGRLVRLTDIAVQDDFGWYLVRPAGRPPATAVAALEAWLIEQGASARPISSREAEPC